MFLKEYTTITYHTYPEGYDEVLRSKEHYWSPPPLQIVGDYTKFCELGSYRYYDTAHPRCYYCGKFVKAGDWWKSELNGPCWTCNDSIKYGW